MTRAEALAEADSTNDPKRLKDLYAEFRSDGRIVDAIVSNDVCPDDIKKDYVLYAITEKFPNYEQLANDAWFRDTLNALRKSLDSWQPIQRLAELPTWDVNDIDANAIIDILERGKRELILYGPPGTSKTRLARMVADHLADNDKTRVRFVQFHASFSYEDFVEGMMPVEHDKTVTFRVVPKIFKKFCTDARADQSRRYVLVIDEINRADLSKVIGELFTCLEYRGEVVTLLYSQEPFQIPQNVYVIGTMNTLDKSTFDIDYALRRRFFFYEVPPSAKRLRSIMASNSLNLELQDELESLFALVDNQGFSLGHAYFKDIKSREDISVLWRCQLKPLLEQFFWKEESKVQQIEQEFERVASTTTPDMGSL